MLDTQEILPLLENVNLMTFKIRRRDDKTNRLIWYGRFLLFDYCFLFDFHELCQLTRLSNTISALSRSIDQVLSLIYLLRYDNI